MAEAKHIAIDGVVYDLSPAAPPSVGNGTLTIQKNGIDVQTFTANQSSNATANIVVPTNVSELTNDSGYTTNTGTVTQVKVGTTEYNPSSGVVSLPDYPTVNNATLTIQKNGTSVQTFTANQNSNATANITVPTKTSELTNDSGYTTNTGTVTQVKVGTTAYNPSSGIVSLPAYPTVNNATLTIQKNGTSVQTFTANQSSNVTANIVVPTKLSDLTNDSNFLQCPSRGLAQSPFYMQTYSENLGVITAGTYGQRSITFGVAFPSECNQFWGFVSLMSAPAYWGDVVLSITDITRTGCKINYGNKGTGATGAAIYVTWLVFGVKL